MAAEAVTANWGALGVCVLVATPALVAIVKGLRAPATLQGRFAEDRRRARAVIEGSRIIPTLTALVTEFNETGSADPSVLPPGDASPQDIENRLQQTDYMRRIRELGELASDHTSLQRLEDDARRWASLKALAAGVFLLGFSYIVARVGVSGLRIPESIVPLAWLIAGLGAAFSVTFGIQEITTCNRLSAIIERYD